MHKSNSGESALRWTLLGLCHRKHWLELWHWCGRVHTLRFLSESRHIYSHIQECLGIKWTWSWQEGRPAVWWSQCVVALRKTMTSFWCTSTTELWKRNYRHHAHWLNWTNATPYTSTYVFHWTNNYPPFLPTFISPYQPSDHHNANYFTSGSRTKNYSLKDDFARCVLSSSVFVHVQQYDLKP